MRGSAFLRRLAATGAFCRGPVNTRGCHSSLPATDASRTLDIVKQHNIPIERVSLSRGLALNRFEKDFFIYPEYSDTDAAETAQQLASDLKDAILEAGGDDEPSFTSLWDKYHLSSYTVPKKYGGENMCNKDLLILCESLGQAWSLYTRFEQTHLAVSLILEYGNERQKTNYLPRIASGALQPAICLPGPGMLVVIL
ncbi:unnamed protein product [Gongylonema pulchrum]|uniref:Acyl-CoA_dh_N domain-containing protein n=1 Tax=Gongylonema pulchrum TaxID=637853 RepID=A0A183EC15_9BILA|nr:unnamed protein product [Gongylonema pulchrum]